MKVLCVADIFARPGREVLKQLLPQLIARHQIDFVVVNWENAAGGRGVTPQVADELLALPVNVFTSGNHIWQHAAFVPYFDHERVLRPHNAPAGRPGRGYGLFATQGGQTVAVINLQGRAYMYESEQLANPFTMAEELVEEMHQRTPCILVELHAELTSEKRAMGWWLDGRVSAVFGTHTHVQTADAQILPKGTAYITDLGMTGPHESVLGMRSEDAIRRFVTDGQERSWKSATTGVRLEGIVLEIDEKSGQGIAIERIHAAI